MSVEAEVLLLRIVAQVCREQSIIDAKP